MTSTARPQPCLRRANLFLNRRSGLASATPKTRRPSPLFNIYDEASAFDIDHEASVAPLLAQHPLGLLAPNLLDVACYPATLLSQRPSLTQDQDAALATPVYYGSD